MEIKDLADAMVKVAALNDERVDTWDRFRKGMALYEKISCILNIKSKYQAIINWLLIDELIKGYYTLDDSALAKLCLDGIDICNDELTATCSKAVADKVQSDILSNIFRQ